MKTEKRTVGRPLGSTKPEADKKKKISVSIGKPLWKEASKFVLAHDHSLSDFIAESIERAMNETNAREAVAAKSTHATLINVINSPIIHLTINNVITLDGDVVHAKTVNHVNEGGVAAEKAFIQKP